MGPERCFWEDLPRKGPLDLEAPGLREQRSCLRIVGAGGGYGQHGLRIWGKLGATRPLPGPQGSLEGVEVRGTIPVLAVPHLHLLGIPPSRGVVCQQLLQMGPWLCPANLSALGQVTEPSWASVTSSVKWDDGVELRKE